MTTSLSEYL